MKLWNRIIGTKGFDVDAVLPYLERLVIAYVDNKGARAVGEAFVHDGEWYWWDNHPFEPVKIDTDMIKIKGWTLYPHDLI
jgi:hypothetical protein